MPGGQVQQQHEPGGPLDQGADRGPPGRSDDQVAFPVAGHGPVRYLGGPLADHDHAGDLALAISRPARPTAGPPAAQAAGQLPAQLTASLDIQAL